MDPDGTTSTVHEAPGLRYLRAVPDTGLVVAGSARGVELYDGEGWRDIGGAQWEQIEFTPNYRSVNVLGTVNGRLQVGVTQLLPEVQSLGSYAVPRDEQYMLGYGLPPPSWPTGMAKGPFSIGPQTRWLLPSARGEVASRSQFFRQSAADIPVAV